jgi:hypothetical protein
MTTILKPTIHSNGTGANSLTDAYTKAMLAVHDAITAVAESGPNGRDYYPQGGDAIQAAVEEHRTRLAALEKVRDELEQLAAHCAEFIR